MSQEVHNLTATTLQPSLLMAIIESSPIAVVMINSDGRIALVNAETETLFGYSRDELLGQLVETLVPERFAALWA